MSKSLGMSLAKDNILVNTLNMGWIDTGQWDRHYREMPPGCTREEFDAMVLKVVPIGRFGKPEDVAGMALFLSSEYASFISAASIDIAGGMGGQIAYYPPSSAISMTPCGRAAKPRPHRQLDQHQPESATAVGSTSRPTAGGTPWICKTRWWSSPAHPRGSGKPLHATSAQRVPSWC
jgi:hypothetical protein